ncbi:MAG: hypothetical protein ACREF0_18030, partial [Acetobacteraceae bacterium]
SIGVYHFRPAVVTDVPEGLANRHLGIHPRTEAILIAQQQQFSFCLDAVTKGQIELPRAAVMIKVREAEVW